MGGLAKRVLVVLGVLVLVVVGYFAYAYHKLEVQSAAAEHVQAEKQSMFQSQLLRYQRALPVGTSRSEVIRYLQIGGISYIQDRWNLLVNIGDEPDVFPCDRWAVYVNFEFGRVQIQANPLPLDPLTAVSLQKIGHCL